MGRANVPPSQIASRKLVAPTTWVPPTNQQTEIRVHAVGNRPSALHCTRVPPDPQQTEATVDAPMFQVNAPHSQVANPTVVARDIRASSCTRAFKKLLPPANKPLGSTSSVPQNSIGQT